MTMMDWDEFVRRGEERRRDRPPERDVVSLVLGCLLFFIVVFWIVWGVMA